jgi:8-oxo-dGTP pyrophosphatase MutT (NUDIX family)
MNSVPIKPAATILLVKESEQGEPELFMVVRHHQIDVASGALVFPGGKVETQDQCEELLAKQTSTLKPQLVPFAVACIREAFEETGVFFARRKGENELLSSEDLKQLEHYRDKLVQETVSLSELLKKENLELACDELLHFAHWITPDMAPKRFDTHFFIAKAPSDQVALHDGEESVDSVWIDASKLLEQADDGKWKLVFPTRMNIEKLARFESFSAIQNYLGTHDVCTVQPEFKSLDEGKFLCIPKEADYPQWKVSIDKVMNP